MKNCLTAPFALAALLSAGANGSAQSVREMVSYDVTHALHDIGATWGSPVYASGEDWAGAAAVVVLGALVSPWDDHIDRWFQSNQHARVFSWLGQFREGGLAFAGKTITPVVAGLYVIGVATKSRAIRDGVWGCAASYAAESVVRTQVFYRFIGRLRPDSSRGSDDPPTSESGDQYQFSYPGGRDWGMHSLPAGHVANVITCASFLSHRFGNSFVTLPAYLIGTAVGVGRQVDRRHWTSDTILGVFFGYAVGKNVGLRSLDRLQQETESPVRSAHTFLVGWRGTF